ncbi:methyl-accepting chemotaxis protein [Cohnella panacarvi]|uniref:methyl-accepting chemotaxis protein n=1 Tax=Cohnella panacarvi TaxID=400776 RepID=UPI0004797D8A|nr:methyl-accepting chemotaxis protein [Cohnella panacarvi]
MLRSVGTKLFLLLFASTLVSVLLVGMISYDKSQSIIAGQMEAVSQQTVKESADKIGLLLKPFEDMSLQFSTSRDLQESLSAIFDPNAEVSGKTRGKADLQDTLNQLARTNTFILSITLLDTVNVNETVNSISAGLIPIDRKAGWYAETMALKGKALWLPPKNDGYTGMAKGNVFALARMIGKSMIVFEIDAELLSQTLGSVRFSESSRMLLADAQGNVLLSSVAENIGQPFSPEPWKDDHLVVSEPLSRTSWTLSGIAPLKELVADTKAIRDLTIVMCLISAALAIGLGYLVILHVGKPLLHIRGMLNEGASGNLSVRTKLRRRDEIGEVSGSFNRMMEQMTRLIDQTRHSASQVLQTSSVLLGVSRQTASAASEISIATNEIAEGSAQLASEAETVHHIVDSMNGDLESVIGATDRINESSLEVKSASSEGKRFMESIVSGTIESEQSIDRLVGRVGRLEQSTEAMQRILDLLDKITKDSKILSLNAGIEAARSGSSSSGFKVIASEMGRLSDQTNESIATVHEMTDAIREEIVQTVKALSTALPLLRSQIESIRTAGGIFASVYENSEAFSLLAERIKHDVRKLGEKQRQLNASIASVSSFSEEASATSEQVAALSAGQLHSSQEVVDIAKELEGLSGVLQKTLMGFKAGESR